MKKIIIPLLIIIMSHFSLAAKVNEMKDDIKKTFKVQKNGNLEVEIISGDIFISTWNKDEVLVIAKSFDEIDEDDLDISSNGREVNISFDGWTNWSEEIDFEIKIPSNFNIDISSTSGDIKLKSALQGKVNISLMAGDVEIERVTGRLDISTNGGDIRIGEVLGPAKIETLGGDIRVSSLHEEADIQTMGGDIIINKGMKYVDAMTYGGDIKVGTLKGSAQLNTMGGDIVVENASASVSAETFGGDISINGASISVKASTYGGNVSLTNIKGYVDVSNLGGDIYVELDPKPGTDSEIETKQGDIKLVIPSRAKVVIEAEVNDYDKNDNKIVSDFAGKETIQRENMTKVFNLNGGGSTIDILTYRSDIRIVKKNK